MLSNHLASVKPNDHNEDSSTSYLIGTCHSSFIKPSFNPMTSWIIDSGASQHICSNANLFTCMKPINHVQVSLPNGTHIPVSISGDIKISSRLILNDVLVVPQFNCNLVSISALIKKYELIVNFFPNHFLI